MPHFIPDHLGGRYVDFALVVLLVVSLTSTAAWLLSRCFARHAAARHLVLLAGLIGSVISPAIVWSFFAADLALISIPLLHGNQTALKTETRPAPQRHGDVPANTASGQPERWNEVAAAKSIFSASPRISDEAPAMEASLPVSQPNDAGGNMAAASPLPSTTISELRPAVANKLSMFDKFAGGALIVWGIGSCLMLARLAFNCYRVRHVRQTSQQVTKDSQVSMLGAISRKLAVSPPKLLVSSHAKIPMAIGLGSPAIVLPERILATISENELHDILTHEVAHLRRGDQRMVVVQELAGALYWPIASIHLLNRALAWAREELCDNIVLGDRDAVQYGQTLLHVAELLVADRPLAATAAIINGRGSFERRIRELIDPNRNTSTTTSRNAAFVVAFTFAVIVAVTSGVRFDAWADANMDANMDANATQPNAESDAQVFIVPVLGDVPINAAKAVDAGAAKPETPARKRFTLKIVGPNGQPVANARVEVRPHPLPKPDEWRIHQGKLERHGTYGPFVTATERGIVAFDEPQQGWQLLNCAITKDGFAPYWAQWNPGENSERVPPEFTAELDAGQSLGGVVTNESGQPIAGVEVHPSIRFKKRPGDLDVLHVGSTHKTDASGRWVNRQVPANVDSLSIEATHPDFAPRSAKLSVSEYRLPENGVPVAKIALRSGIVVTGQVVDAQGAPIADAFVRTTFANDQREVRTDKEGRYRLPGCPAIRATLVASATGHAPELRTLALSPNDNVVNFQLPPPRTLRVKVVDGQGKPVPKTRIFFQQWRTNRNDFELGKVHAYTDDQGIWEWRDAPADEIVCDICPPDGVQLARRTIQAREAEWLFTATPALKISGKVTDRQSREAVAVFRVTPGRRYRSGVLWDRGDGFEAKAGTYEIRPYPSDDALQLVMIQADGYLPGITRDVKPTEGSVVLDVELVRGTDITPRILMPSGAPAVKADVALGVKDSQIQLVSGGFSQHGTYCDRRTADADGRIRFPPQGGPFHLLVTHPSGFAHVVGDAKSTLETIKLQSWSRIEGVFRDGTTPVPNATISIDVRPTTFLNVDRVVDWPNISANYRIQTDDEGRFVVDGIVPGPGNVGHEVRFRVLANGCSTAMSHSKPVTFASGETTRLTMRGTGQPVTGRLQPPDGVADVDWNFGLVRLSPLSRVDPQPIPEEKKKDPVEQQKWLDEWLQTPAGQAWRTAYAADVARRENGMDCAAAINKDGTFRVSDVPSGEYELTVELSDSKHIALGRLTRQLKIPAFPNGRSSEALDLGTLTLK